MRILPSRSRIVALISPTFSVRRIDTSCLPSTIACRASRTHIGHSESVSRGQPSGGLVFCHDLFSGLSDHFGVNDGLRLIEFSVLKTCHTPLAAIGQSLLDVFDRSMHRDSSPPTTPHRGFSGGPGLSTGRASLS